MNAASHYKHALQVGPFLQDIATLSTPLDGLPDAKVLAIACAADGTVYAGTQSGLAEWLPAANRWKPVGTGPLASAPIVRLQSDGQGGMWTTTMQEAYHFAAGRPDAPVKVTRDQIPHKEASDGHGGVWRIVSDRLIYHTQNADLEITGNDGFPLPQSHCLALGPDGALWVGGNDGCARLSAGRWRYYAGRRWLLSNVVTCLAPDSLGNVWIGTEGGVSQLRFVPMTFPQKATHYEHITAERHNRDGLVTDCGLTRPGDLASFLFEASDNDGLWTALYASAESFRYAVTYDPEARDLARKSMNALLQLVHVTGIPGFPARTFMHKGERVNQSDPGPNWYPSPTVPDVLYKDDTSSDEIDGHYFFWYIYSKCVANAEEKHRIAEVCRAVTNHILDHNYTLVGPTGKHTRWGVWGPDALNDDPKWEEERGLNSLEILSHLKVAIHLCGDARFREAYHDLIVRHHYALNTIRQKRLPPDGENNHSDDELAACAYYPLLQLEEDPHLRSMYLMSLERTQAVLQPEGSPFHNVIYGACTGQPCDAEAAVQWLRDAPWDLRDWAMTNSHRADVTMDTEAGRFKEKQLTHVLPPGETVVGKWNRNPYVPDGGGDGSSEEDGAFWLLPYWMGRFHAIFQEQASEELKGEKQQVSKATQ